MWPPVRILHPTDFSDCSEHAFDLACGLAAQSHGTVVVLHVFAPFVAFDGSMPYPIDNEDEASARRKLNMIQSRYANVNLEHRFVTGTAVEMILNTVKSEKADLVVMGSHGRAGLKRLLLGSVAEHVLRRSSGPVLIARQSEKEPANTTKSSKASSNLERAGVR